MKLKFSRLAALVALSSVAAAASAQDVIRIGHVGPTAAALRIWVKTTKTARVWPLKT